MSLRVIYLLAGGCPVGNQPVKAVALTALVGNLGAQTGRLGRDVG